MRFIAGITMFFIFSAIMYSGRPDLVSFSLLLIQGKVFHELRRLKLTNEGVQNEGIQTMLDWKLFGIASIASICNIWNIKDTAVWLAIFFLYTNWFAIWVLIVLNRVHRKEIKSRLLHASWSHLCVFYTVLQPVIMDCNIRNGGLFWFVLPCCLVICNDVCAYAFGTTGKTKLINLSPNKTLEGFVGAMFATCFIGYTLSPFLTSLDSLVVINESNRVVYEKIQWHGLAMALFASLVAPFGGFFASAMKRATGIKDFGNWIPGHGGLTDRVDCQLFMASFTYFYYQFITTQ